KFTAAFENLANRIFEEKSQKFTQENRSRLDEILDPLRERIREFEQKVDSTNKEHLARNVSLIEQIHNLEKLNRQISEDAENLTKALKGDVKVRGNWGEVILERILEESGLQKGREYETQASFTEEDGSRKQLDVLIKLPEEKYLIIDSKLSLLDYERLVAAEEEAEQQQHLRKLLSSVRTHIEGLYRKHYHDLKEINTPDFVLLFMPIEGCFSVVVQNDQGLYQYALEKHIVIVSPSTLLVTLRTIAFIWRQENQTRNAMEIARQSGNLYDAFVRLLEDLEKIGNSISKADQVYQEAVKRISTGRGNLVSRVENLRQLGAKASKNIPDNFQNEPAMIEEESKEN
ncbi:MAG: DNA recombination protein RmuC, partial [Candidatus Cloacimonetes bacterium]|nr:DNA recombination protein RmuC [Candidatus Cloacimonadota bacterium]